MLDVTEGRVPLRSLFSKEQRAFYDEHAPAGLDMKALRVQGPILVLRAKHRPEEFKRGMTVELWLWKDGKHILELSTKALPAEAFQAGMEFRTYLQEHGVDLGTKQETKTRTAMEKFKADGKPRRRGTKTTTRARKRA